MRQTENLALSFKTGVHQCESKFSALKVTSHLQRPKKLFFFPSHKKKVLKSLKAPELFRKMYFQIKVIKSGGCNNLVPGRVPWGNFRGNRLSWGLFFKLFAHFVCIAHFTAEWNSFSLLWACFLSVCLFVCCLFLYWTFFRF